MRSITKALIQECPLLKWDAEGDDIVFIRQARIHEENRREAAWNRIVIERQADSETEVRQIPWGALRVMECYLTFEDSTLMEECENGEKRLLFKKGMGEAEFREAFGRLPLELASEWWSHVRKVNPHWGTLGLEEVQKN